MPDMHTARGPGDTPTRCYHGSRFSPRLSRPAGDVACPPLLSLPGIVTDVSVDHGNLHVTIQETLSVLIPADLNEGLGWAVVHGANGGTLAQEKFVLSWSSRASRSDQPSCTGRSARPPLDGLDPRL